jgi:hypothetical protein
MLRDAAISLSLANLCFVKVWGKALSGAGSYFTEFKIAYAALMLDVLLLAAIFFAGITLARRISRPLFSNAARWAFLGALLTATNGIAVLSITLAGINLSTMLGRSPVYYVGLGLTAALVAAAITFRQRVIGHAPRVILVLLPFVLITFSQAIFKLVQNVGVVHAESRPVSPDNTSRNKPASRVLWIVFDELDQRLTFSRRPDGVELPELDRLRSQSFFATNAYPPAPLTYMSMPALITGRLVAKVTPVRADELMLKFDGQQNEVPWSTQPNVFSKARAAGFNTGLAGWCHPYCEVIGDSLTKCDEVKEKNNDEISLATSMFSQASGLISTIPLVQQTTIPIVQRVGWANQIVTNTERKKYTVRYKSVLESSLRVAVDPNLDLVFVHSPAPHPPGIYDRSKNDFSLESKSSYADNLELVDRTIGDIRRAMEQAGIWDQTTVIISADHWWRSEMWSRGPFWTPEDAKVAGELMDHRIPFLVKMAGQRNSLTYEPGFNTVVTHGLVLALMKGEVTNSTDLADWLDRNRTISDSPYNRDELLP